jgi:drug/metabolite transporter (DMT)-like permease
MIALVFASIALLGWGIGDVFQTYASRKIGAYNASLYGYLFGGLLASFYIPFALDSWRYFSLSMLLLTLLLALTNILAFWAYNESLKIGNSSLVGTIAGSFTALVVILSLLFLGERLLMQQVVPIIIIFVGLFLSSINFSDLKKKESIINRSIILALLAMIGWAIYFTFIKIPIQEVGFFWPSYVTSVAGTLFFIIFGLKKIKMPKLSYGSGFPAVFLASTLLTLGSFSFNFAIGKGLSSIVAPIAGAYPALFAFLAFLIFKDPMSRQQKLGMVVVLLGIILLSYFSR